MPMRAALGVALHEVEPGVSAGRFGGYLTYDERLQQLRLLPDDWVEPGSTPDAREVARSAERVEQHRAALEEETAYFGHVDPPQLVDDLRRRGLHARVREGASAELTVVELLGEPYEREHFCIELRRGESVVVADYGSEAALPADFEERLALIHEGLEQQLIQI